jgi:hypothetical protein
VLKISEMEENAYQLFQRELEVHKVMKVHHEERVFSLNLSMLRVHECSWNPAGLPNSSLQCRIEHFIDDEPPQYAKLTMSVVQDFIFSWSTSNPMVYYKIYNKSVDLPFDVFCAAIRVP